MEVTAVGAVVIGLAAIAFFSGRLFPALLLGATIPLSASAAIVVGWAGGATILCSIIAAAAVIARAGAEGAGAILRGEPPRLGPAECLLIAFAASAVAGAYALPRLFAGATEVYSLDRTVVGVTEGVLRFPLTALKPTAGNVTQSVYLIVSALLCLAVASLQYKETRFISLLAWSATVSQICFAIADAVGVGLMSAFRTATYALAPEQAFAGFTRLVGGATEPSFFGAVSATLLVWHLWRWRLFGGVSSALAAGAMAICALGSLSSTALAVAGGALALHLAASLVAARSLAAYGGAFLAAGVGLALAGWLALGPLGPMLASSLDLLFFQKLASESGIERTAWASQAITNFLDTSGWGAGLGAARANGWMAAVLGQTGAPGAVLAAGFLLAAFARQLDRAAAPHRAAAIAMLAAACLSASRVDLGLLFFAFAGAVLAAPQPYPIGRLRHAPYPV